MAGWRARVARAATGLVLLATAVGTVATGPAPVGAATPRTTGEVVVDDASGHVFVTDGDTVTVHDHDGGPVATLTGQTGAADLFVRSGTVYVLASGAQRITTVDAATLEVTGGWDLGLPQVRAMAWAGGRIWFTHGDQWGALGSLDPVTGTVDDDVLGELVRASSVLEGAPDAARLFLLPHLSPGRISVYDVSGSTPILLDRAPHDPDPCGATRDLAVSPDATTAWTACGAPYVFSQWDLADLSAPTTALVASPYPNGVSATAGGFVVGSLQRASNNVRLYEPGATTPVKTLTAPVPPAMGMVAGSAGGERLYVGTTDGGFHTFRLDPVVTGVAPSPVDRGATVTVTGTGLADVTEARLGGLVTTATVVSDTRLTFPVPAGLANGTHPLLLTSRWGDSADTPASVRVFGPELPYVPAAPTATVDAPHGVTVTWPALPEDSWPATGYEVTAWVGGEAVGTETVTERSATFTGLRAETDHTFTVVAVNEVGRSAASPPSAAVAPRGLVGPFGSLRALVERQWVDMVDRAPAASESDPWVDRLRAGTHTPGDVVAFLRGSHDHAAAVDPVVRLYLAAFLRLPDAGGLDYWAGRRRTGTSIAQVAQAFASSPEFRTLYGPLANRDFVALLYVNILGRDGDTAGVDYWTAELDAGRRTRGQVLAGFSEAIENRTARASTVATGVLFAQLLGRVPTGSERSATVDRLDGGTSVATVAGEILGGDEYAARIPG
jgi:hypothetical protein